MADSHPVGAASPESERASALLSALHALRRDGAATAEPARFGVADALAARLDGQPAAVRRVLEDRLEAVLAACRLRIDGRREDASAARVPTAPAGTPSAPTASAPTASAPTASAPAASRRTSRERPLALLTAELAARSGGGEQLRNGRRFQESWARIRAVERAESALARAPANAGPLNSHLLLLRALELMRELSPDYLRRFVAQSDALLALERLDPVGPSAQTRAGRRQSRRK